MTRLEKGSSSLVPYRRGYAAGWLGLPNDDHDYPADSPEAHAFAVGYRVGKRESMRYAPKFGAQSMRAKP
jgi:hypothetical protein